MFPLRDNLPTRRTPVVTIGLIVANVLVYFLWQRGGLVFGEPHGTHYLKELIRWAAIPFELTHPGRHCGFAEVPAPGGIAIDPNHIVCSGAFYPRHQPPTWVTPFTAMFMHGGLLHLGGNMLFLWIFGNNVEDSMGRIRYLLFYLLAGLAAFALQTAINPDAMVPTLGASGAIAGVLGGYLVLYPAARVVTVLFIVLFFTILELPALVFLIIWFAEQAVFGALNLTQPTGNGGGVAYFAHVGGFIFGLVAVRLFANRRKDVPSARFPVY
jgi:membrane associated rhomboid family serine protease